MINCTQTLPAHSPSACPWSLAPPRLSFCPWQCSPLWPSVPIQNWVSGVLSLSRLQASLSQEPAHAVSQTLIPCLGEQPGHTYLFSTESKTPGAVPGAQLLQRHFWGALASSRGRMRGWGGSHPGGPSWLMRRGAFCSVLGPLSVHLCWGQRNSLLCPGTFSACLSLFGLL